MNIQDFVTSENSTSGANTLNAEVELKAVSKDETIQHIQSELTHTSVRKRELEQSFSLLQRDNTSKVQRIEEISQKLNATETQVSELKGYLKTVKIANRKFCREIQERDHLENGKSVVIRHQREQIKELQSALGEATKNKEATERENEILKKNIEEFKVILRRFEVKQQESSCQSKS